MTSMSSTGSRPARRRRPYAPRMPLEQRREQLLDAALAIIARDGYAGISIDAIAREAGVARTVVYGAFDGLGALLYKLLDRQERRALRQLLQALPANVASGEPATLVDTIRRLAESVAGDPDTWRPILLPPEGTPPAVRDRIGRSRDLVRTQVQALLEHALDRFNGPALDAEILAHALVAVAEHFAQMIVEDPPRYTTDRLVTAFEGVLATAGLPSSS
jgi:AcrR family transcriptional regulator